MEQRAGRGQVGKGSEARTGHGRRSKYSSRDKAEKGLWVEEWQLWRPGRVLQDHWNADRAPEAGRWA